MTLFSVLGAVLLLVAGPAAASGCRVVGGAHVTPVVELYTSEGCDSCPPADRWLSARFPPGGARGAIPLAFHVDYWDRLGWTDRFASAEASERQRQAARANRSVQVYTPQVLLQGRDFPGWRHGDLDAALARAATRPARTALTLDAVAGAAEIAVRAQVTVPVAGAVLVVALVDSGHATDVAAGENRGVRLRHDHVVRAFATRSLAGGASTVDIGLPRRPAAGTHPTVVAIVQEADRGDVLHAVALPLSGCP